MTHFILCSGRARHGKDTSAEIIKDNLETRGYRVLVTHYADLLKYICKNGFEHHVCFVRGHVAAALEEAREANLKWKG